MPIRRARLSAALALGAVAIAAGAWAVSGARVEGTDLGLMTTLPIYWRESASVPEALDGSGEPHWARTALERKYQLVPLDTLDTQSLGRLHALLLAQPRALSGEENVALDDWVRAGGHVLLFADPMLTAGSRFAIGDRRRPQDVILLSPILRRWGLELRFDEDQPDGERTIEVSGHPVPVDLAGSFAAVPPAGGAPADCRIEASATVADCTIGKGHALIIADAALLDPAREAGSARTTLQALAERAFAE
jgi:hypothetical protein